jgi:acyl-CoA dehydrogenase
LDFSVGEEALKFQDRVKKFTLEKVIPRTDLDTPNHFPIELYEAAFQEGIITAAIPKKYGGTEKSFFELVLAAEELAYGDLGFCTSALLMKLATGSILAFGTEDQKERWVRPLTEKLTFASHVWSEPEGSSNMIGRPATTTATPTEGGFLINGIKSTITNAGVASVFTVFARVLPHENGLSCFMVSRDSKGVSVKHPYEKMGQRASDTAEITFKNVFVPERDLIGKIGQGVQISMRAILSSRVGISAMAIGVARRARDLAKAYGHTHFAANGQALIFQQDFRFKIAEVEAEIEMVRALTWKACWEVENGANGMKLASCSKLLGANMAVKATNVCAELLGAQGYLKSGLAEKLIRDAKVLQIYEGTGTIQKMIISDMVCRLAGLELP